MLESIFKQFIKKNNLRLIFLFLLGLFISDNGFAAYNKWIRDYVRVTWTDEGNFIVITATVLYCSYENFTKHGYLDYCKLEASYDNQKFFYLMVIQTRRPIMTNSTTVYLKNKLNKASISFTENVVTPGVGSVWPDHLGSFMQVEVPDSPHLAVIGIGWKLNSEFKNVSFIRISGRWRTTGCPVKSFYNIIYRKIPYEVNSIIPDVITKEFEKDTVRVFKDSEAIVIKGADPGANIKVFSTSGLVIKSVIADNDVVKIKLSAKQIYIVHVGASRYKVAL